MCKRPLIILNGAISLLSVEEKMPFYLKWWGSSCNLSINLSKNIEYIKTHGNKKEHWVKIHAISHKSPRNRKYVFFKGFMSLWLHWLCAWYKKWGWHFLLISIYATHVVQILLFWWTKSWHFLYDNIITLFSFSPYRKEKG